MAVSILPFKEQAAFLLSGKNAFVAVCHTLKQIAWGQETTLL
jgi:hypothetical protein